MSGFEPMSFRKSSLLPRMREKSLKISSQRLARQRSIKRSANTTPIVKMKNSDIEEENLKAFATSPRCYLEDMVGNNTT
jgi:hypothetical protein